MKKLFYILTLILFITSYTTAQYNQSVSKIINQVNIDSLYNNLRIITGDNSFTTHEGTFTILSRHSDNIGNQYAADFLYEKLKSYGLQTFRQNFDENGQNVYALHYGVRRNQYVMICAHYDDKPTGSFAPGADDNGSGTTAVIESARILSKYFFEYTIIFALWDQEEQGLFGSDYYAQLAANRGDSIIAVINLDMIAWDSNNDNIMEIHTRAYNKSQWLANYVKKINKNYNIGLVIQIIDPGTTRSDHYSFWLRNFSSVLLIEDSNPNPGGGSDFNSYYHTALDNLEGINQNYLFKNTKLTIGSVASLVINNDIDTSNIYISPSVILYQNYPNPFNQTTTIKYELPKDCFVTLKVYDILGNEIAILENDFKKAGINYSNFEMQNKNFASGVYFYVLNALGVTEIKKMVIVK